MYASVLNCMIVFAAFTSAAMHYTQLHNYMVMLFLLHCTHRFAFGTARSLLSAVLVNLVSFCMNISVIYSGVIPFLLLWTNTAVCSLTPFWIGRVPLALNIGSDGVGFTFLVWGSMVYCGLSYMILNASFCNLWILLMWFDWPQNVLQ